MSSASRRKAFGQHFLVDERIIGEIVEHAFEQVRENGARTLLEIGPGPGAITNKLLKSLGALERFHIVEMDRRFADHWTAETALNPTVNVISQDFLKVPLEDVLAPAPVVVVSNLPYSSGTAILFRLVDRAAEIPAMVLMFQREVAERLRAEPDSNDWGSLSLWVQNRWDVTKLLTVPAKAFSPPPKVVSEVVLLRPRTEMRIAGTKEEMVLFDRLLRATFAHRRKMLRSSLPKDAPYLEALRAAGIPDTARAESLGWDEWDRWFTELLKLRARG